MYASLGAIADLAMDVEIRTQPSQALRMLRRGTLASMCVSRAKGVQEAVFSSGQTPSDRRTAWECLSDGLGSTEPDEEGPEEKMEAIREELHRAIKAQTYGGTPRDLIRKELEKQGIPWGYNPISKGVSADPSEEMKALWKKYGLKDSRAS